MMTLSAVSGTRRANTGGPASRTRREPVSCTLLDDGEGPGHCRRLITLGLTFPEGEDPVDWVEEALARVGHADAETLRRSLMLPAGGLICAPAPDRTAWMWLATRSTASWSRRYCWAYATPMAIFRSGRCSGHEPP